MHVCSHTKAYACQNYMHLCLLPSQVYNLKSREHCSFSPSLESCFTQTRNSKLKEELKPGHYQSMEIDDRKINQSIDGNRLRLVNWHRLASANRWTIDNHRKVVVNYIDWHRLLFKVKTCKRWQAAHLHRHDTFETFYILLHWGDLFQGILKFKIWTMISLLYSGPRYGSVQFMFSKGKLCKWSRTF